MEVDSGLRADVGGERVVKEIHQHRLAAAHIAEQVKAPREPGGDRTSRGLAAAAEPREQGFVRLQRLGGRALDGWCVIMP